jgi:hypothetical protein
MGRVGYAGTLAERMARKCVVDEATGCWNWHGAKDTKGYGQLRVDGRGRLATHIALELVGKPRPADRPCALHRCDNPGCVNPDHLWWGTLKENTGDAKAKGRLNLSGLEIGHKLASARKEPLPVVTCTGCSVSFTTSKFRFQNNKTHFCDAACCRAWQSKRFKGTRRSDFLRGVAA